MKLGCTYIKVSNMDKSIEFYRKLLRLDPVYLNRERWVVFTCGNSIALYNPQYDLDRLDSAAPGVYSAEYRQFIQRETHGAAGNVVFNFACDDLAEEYRRITHLNIGTVSGIMCLNITAPYSFFTISDPDGNVIEITGPYQPERGSAQ